MPLLEFASFYVAWPFILFTQVSLKAVYLWIELRKIESECNFYILKFSRKSKNGFKGYFNLIAFGNMAYSILFYFGLL